MLGSILTIIFLISIVIALKIIGDRLGRWIDNEMEKPREKVEYGTRDKDGYCEILVNGKSTGRKVLIFTEKQAKQIKKMTNKIENGSDKTGRNKE
jgi:hypothetical protein